MLLFWLSLRCVLHPPLSCLGIVSIQHSKLAAHPQNESREQNIYYFRRVGWVTIIKTPRTKLTTHTDILHEPRTSGLGKGAAQLLTQHDAYVALFDLADNQDVVSQLPGGRAKFFKVDVTSTSDIQEAVDATVQWTKETNAPLGGVVASAGIAAPAKVL